MSPHCSVASPCVVERITAVGTADAALGLRLDSVVAREQHDRLG
jgi:hypothetical protein